MSKTCHNCNNVFDDNYNICPRCGMQYIASDPSMSGRVEQSGMPAAPYGQPTAPYGQPAAPYNRPAAPVEQPMSVGQWVGTILLSTCFGIISIVLLFVWGFSDTTPTAKKNYCRAMLIVEAIGFALAILMLIVVVSVLAANGDRLTEFFEELEKIANY